MGNMPNPFDQGAATANLAQIFGAFGLDWFFPVAPRRPLTDGVCFARSDEAMGPDGWSQLMSFNSEDTEVEQLWRQRFNVRAPVIQAVSDQGDAGPLSSLSAFTRWWNAE